uniref:Uncharacterized protein n=1 Tax=Acrobeloides nanus TaxID=290746 RepID=A0A914CWF1_9BILA
MSYEELENLFLQRYNVKNISRGGVISKGREKNECPLMHSLIELNEDFHDTDNFENFWSSFQYLKNFSQHLFISMNNTHYASDVCSKKNTKNPKILSIFHEYNMPYEVPCINCAHGTNDNDTVYGSTYHMYMSGRIGQSEIHCIGGDKHNCTSTHESITIPSRILREVLGFSFGSPYYRQFTYKYEDYSGNYLSQWSTENWERHGAVFHAERSNSIENGFMDELVPKISNTTGSLLVNPAIELHRWHDTLMNDLYLGRLSTIDEQKTCIDMRNLFWKYFYWNAGSFYCKKVR